MTDELASSRDRVLVSIERDLYAEALQAAAHFGIPVEEWFARAARDKLAAEPIRPPVDSGVGPVRTPYVESGITTRDTRSSAG
ncbi:MAG TPA: hypothetical protein VFN74_23175 [Chloroflexota bacterium]|nr:hypothetical protein [Chloroflexota bacterium]